MSRKKFTHQELLVLHLWILILSGTITAYEDGSAVKKVVVTEGSDVLLDCSLSTKQNIVRELFVWRKDDQKEVFMCDAGLHDNNGRAGQDEQFKGRVSHFSDELKHGNASIIIRNTTMADSGVYTCDFPRLQRTFHIRLVVAFLLKDRTCENPGAAAEPLITIVDITKLGVRVKCDVRGASPQPKLQWKHSDGSVLPAEEPQVSERENRYNVTLWTTVTKTTTNRFHCVASQEEIGHVIHAEVALSEKLFEATHSRLPVTGWVAVLLVVLAAVVVLLLLRAAKHRKILCYKGPAVKKVVVPEGSDVILPCSLNTKQNIEQELFVWRKDGQKNVFLYDAGILYNNGRAGQDEQFKGRVSHFSDELKHGNASIIIRNTMVADSGDYTCDFPLLQPRQTFHIRLVVESRLEDIYPDMFPDMV
ncbi:programmed cell death 1 ligand 1-like isoform X2 [Chelmon rostratus]|uniref:programmed cell death 1 ligand 1-like isoform X2 n=1 Tax=Chelmon rostratus TaxID=109905 RepID=UPI001BEA56A6|nr:programmed cell death 1 ligand 1-like isoform X2 [Chelmon rostratus]